MVALLWLVLISAVFLPAEAASMFFLLIVLVKFSRGQLSIRSYGVVASTPFLAIIMLGVMNSMSYPTYEIIKDIWHFSLPILTILVGWVMVGDWEPIPLQKQVAYFSAYISSTILLKGVWLVLIESIQFGDKYEWRQALGPGEFVSIWGFFAALDLLLKHKCEERKNKLLIMILFLNIVSIIISDSRTALLFLLGGLFIVFIPKYLMIGKRIYWLSVIVAGCLLIGVLLSGGGDPTTTTGRLQNMVWEQFSFSFVDQGDVNAKYRAFESLAAINTILAGSWLDIIFGYGFGKMVDLGMVITLGVPGQKSEYQFIPILHNGYLYLLVKTGVFGLILFVGFLARTVRAFLITKVEESREFWGLIGTVILMGTSIGTIVMAGPFSKGEFFTGFIILGMAMRYCDLGKMNDKN
jgi:hypothetical protein